MARTFEIDWSEVDEVHVAPTFGPAHETDGDGCWCSPTVERVPRDGDDDGILIVHRSMN